MALTENKIGTIPFIALRGVTKPPGPKAVVDDRPGVDGSEKILIGTKGEPFVLLSEVDAESYADAKAAIKDYQQLIDGDALTLVQGGVSSDGLGYRVLVIDVQEVACFAIRSPVGNKLNSPSLGFVRAQWTLVGVPVS
jgi:hypothetical protein